jgi:hypothetical protein
LAIASMSQIASKPSQIPVAFVSLGWCESRPAISWPTFRGHGGAERQEHCRAGAGLCIGA